MSGSNIFVMYTSADGQNVTVSPRLGTGHVQPQHATDAQVELLAGSGIADGMMTANVKYVSSIAIVHHQASADCWIFCS